MQKSRTELKGLFETGDVPTEQDYADLIDSFINRIDDDGVDTGWVAPNLLNGIQNYGNGQADARYRKHYGVVYLQGVITGGSANDTIFQLPEGMRPQDKNVFTAINDDDTLARIDVLANGSVVLAQPSPAWTSLSGINFSV